MIYAELDLVTPLAVLFEYRGLGVGSALMTEGLRIAETIGSRSAFLVGDPNKYERSGFKLTRLYGISHESMPAEYVQVKEIAPNGLDGITGLIKM